MPRETFEETYETYRPLLYHFLSNKVKNREDAEELVQDIFLNCFYYWNQYNEDIASFKTWIYHIASNKLKNYYRDQKNDILVDFNCQPSSDSNYSFSEQLIDVDFSDDLIERCSQKMYLNDIISCLNDIQQKVVILRYYSEYSLLEISEEVGRSKENVGVILHRSIRKLRQEIRKQGYVYGV